MAAACLHWDWTIVYWHNRFNKDGVVSFNTVGQWKPMCTHNSICFLIAFNWCDIVYILCTGTHTHDVHVHTLPPSHAHMLTWCFHCSTSIVSTADSIHLYGYLVVDVWDHDNTNPDDFLGRVMIPLGEIPSDAPGECWYPLMKRNVKDGQISGSLKLRTHLVVDESKVFISWWQYISEFHFQFRRISYQSLNLFSSLPPP